MTEREWSASFNYENMIRLMEQLRPSKRKLRLFACACCYRIMDLLLDDRSRAALTTNERYADRLASRTQVAAALLSAEAAFDDIARGLTNVLRSQRACAAVAVVEALRQGQVKATEQGQPIEDWEWVAAAARMAGRASHPQARGKQELWGASIDERKRQAALLRCIVGNPVRPAHAQPRWLAWNDGTVPSLAGDAYDNRHLPSGLLDNEKLAILADALEEAGCDNDEIIGHLRAGGNHVRGCWVVDLLLCKQ